MWKALTDIFPFLCTKERLDHAVFPGIRVLLPWWLRKMNSSFFSFQEFNHAVLRMHLKVVISIHPPMIPETWR